MTGQLRDGALSGVHKQASAEANKSASPSSSPSKPPNPSVDDELEALDSETSEALDNIVREFCAPRDAPIDELVERIRARRQALPLKSGEATEIVGLCKQTIVVGGAVLAMLVTLFGPQYAALTGMGTKKALTVIGIFAGELWMLSLAILILHVLQSTFRYPFLYLRRTGNAWPYFYYAALDPMTPRWPLNSRGHRKDGARYYSKDLLATAKRVVAETPSGRLRNELQQYSLLLSYQGYSHQFSLRLCRWYLVGFVGLSLSNILLTLFVLIWR